MGTLTGFFFIDLAILGAIFGLLIIPVSALLQIWVQYATNTKYRGCKVARILMYLVYRREFAEYDTDMSESLYKYPSGKCGSIHIGHIIGLAALFGGIPIILHLLTLFPVVVGTLLALIALTKLSRFVFKLKEKLDIHVKDKKAHK